MQYLNPNGHLTKARLLQYWVSISPTSLCFCQSMCPLIMLAPSMALLDTVPSFQSSIKTWHNEAWLEKTISTRHSAEEKGEQLRSPRTIHTLWVLQNPFQSPQSNSGSTGPSVGTVLTFPARLGLKGKQHSQPVSRVYFSLSETKFLSPWELSTVPNKSD